MVRRVVLADGRTSSLLVLRPVLSYAQRRGVDTASLLAELGLSPKLLGEAYHRVPEALRLRAWWACWERAGDEAFGLRVAEHAGVGAFDVLDYAAAFSSTLGEAVERLARFYRLLGDAWRLEVTRYAGRAYLRREPSPVPPEEECYYATLCLRARQLTGGALDPLEVHFAHPAPRSTAAHQQLFRARVRFGCPTSAIVFDVRALGAPVATARPELAAVLDRYARDLLARLPASESFTDRVRHEVARLLHHGPPAIGSIARALHASPRTVQRRLLEEGTTFRQVVDGVRREQAARYLDTPDLSLTEIAFLLGFSEASGFRKTYRRWTGNSPVRARAR